jgi:tetratricopeptide (TPR) repeat protein
MMTLNQTLRLALASTIALTLAGTLLAQDTITLKRSTRRGTKLVGKISDVSPTEITISSSGTERKVPVSDVERISLAGEPAGLRQARAAILAGQYEQATQSLENLEEPSDSAPVLRQEIAFHRALASANLALRGGGDADAASQKLLDFVRQNRTSFHFYEAAELLGQLAQVSGNYENAARYYQQLAKAPWPEYTLRSHVLIGDSLRAQGKPDEALQQYDKALAADASEPSVLRQQTLARIGQAACQAEKGETDRAIEALEQVIAKNDPADGELFAQAYLALGTAYRKAERTVDAVLAYLHIDLLFYAQRSAHAEALYYLSTLWPLVEEPARGVESRQLLQSRYAGSVWAKRAN